MVGTSRNVAAAILVLALAAAGPASGRTNVQCSPKSSCPDLYVTEVTWHFADGGRTLVLVSDVENVGAAEAPASTVEGAAVAPDVQGWSPSSVDVLPLKADSDTVSVEVPLAIPDAARGTRQAFTVVVDPNDAVDETFEDNNDGSADVFLPAGNLGIASAPTFAFADGGRKLVVTAVVANSGKGPTAATSVTAGAPGWTPGTAKIASLDLGGSEPVDIDVPIPDAARGGTVPVSATVDPRRDVAETSYDDNVSPSVDVALPSGDLTAAIVGSRLDADRGRLVLSVRVTNVEAGPTAETSVRVESSGWDSRATRVPSLDAGADTTEELTLSVPPGAAGAMPSFVATVDPAHNVSESNYGNNRSRPFTVGVPTPPPPSRPPPPRLGPNLRVRIVSATVKGDPRIELVLAVRNTGDAASRPTTVAVAARGGPSRAAAVPSVPAQATRRVAVRLTVAEPRRDRTLGYKAVIDPAHDIPESTYADNASRRFPVVVRARAAPPPAASSSGRPGWELALGALALVLAALAGGFGLSRLRIRARVRWQRTAQDGGPPEACEVPQSYVWRRSCKPKPALRKIEGVRLLARVGDEEVEHELDAKLVKALNRALRARRLGRGEQKLDGFLEPVAQGLAGAAEAWLAGSSGPVEASAHLKGGKLECEFKRYECVRRGPACTWQERQSWTAEVEDEADEPVALIDVPVPVGPEGAARVARLRQELRAFLERVDFPGLQTPPETAPVPH